MITHKDACWIVQHTECLQQQLTAGRGIKTQAFFVLYMFCVNRRTHALLSQTH